MHGTLPDLESISFRSSSTYTFVREIGRGGMGVVYLARKTCEGVTDHVVLKTIRMVSTERIAKLRREANIAAALRHQNIVRCHGLESIPVLALEGCPPKSVMNDAAAVTSPATGTQRIDPRVEGTMLLERMRKGVKPDGAETSTMVIDAGAGMDETVDESTGERLYIMVMDYVEGFDLACMFNRHATSGLLLSLPISGFIISRICRALGYAHNYIVHRDVSPENILVNTQGVVMLTDFGIAVAAGSKEHGFAGKIVYMSPEQIAGEEVDGRSDVYSLGIVAYQMATGINPFHPPAGLNFRDRVDFVRVRMDKPVPPPSEICRDIPEVYSRIIVKMMARNPEDRYQSIAAAGNDLEKDYLYSSGFGPTNNSLEAYIDLMQNNFSGLTEKHSEQLSFLDSGVDGALKLGRPATAETFTDKGAGMLRAIYEGHPLTETFEQAG